MTFMNNSIISWLIEKVSRENQVWNNVIQEWYDTREALFVYMQNRVRLVITD